MIFLLLIVAVQAPSFDQQVKQAVAESECRRQEIEIVVCAKRGQIQKYRTVDPNLPFDPTGRVMSVARERSRWIEGGESGPQSCSAVGPGGWTGCMIQQWKRNDLQNPWRVGSPVR